MSNISWQFFENLNWADFVIIGLIALSAIISLARGFIREAISLATWVVAVWIAIRFGTLLADALTPYLHNSTIRALVAFGGLFLVVLIVGGVVNMAFSQLVDNVGLDGLDRLIGLLFGLARGILLIGVLVLLADMSDFSKNSWWQTSQLIPYFQGLATWLHSFVPEQLGHLQALASNIQKS